MKPHEVVSAIALVVGFGGLNMAFFTGGSDSVFLALMIVAVCFVVLCFTGRVQREENEFEEAKRQMHERIERERFEREVDARLAKYRPPAQPLD